MKVLADRILVLPTPRKETTDSGLILAETTPYIPTTGQVVAVGTGSVKGGKLIPVACQEGDTIMFGKNSGFKLNYEGVAYIMMSESDVIAVLG